MKKKLSLLFIIVCALSLGGCGGIFAKARGVEHMLVIQTLGFDRADRGVRLSLASSAGVSAEEGPKRMQGEGPSITAAIETVRGSVNEEELFCAHIGHVLIGEETAETGIGELLNYICRSPELRISVPVYVVRGGTAGACVLTVGDGRHGVCDALDSVAGEVKLRGDGRSTSAAEIAQGLARRGSALVCAIRCIPSAERDESAGEESQQALKTVTADGYAVLDGERLAAFIDRENAVGVGLLTGAAGLCELPVVDRNGQTQTLTLTDGHSRLRPVWNADGALTGLDVDVRASAILSESGDGGDEDYEQSLTALFEQELSTRIAAVLKLERRLGVDFLGLAEQLSRTDSGRFDAMAEPFAAALPELTFQVSVSGQLSHTSDLREDL